MSPLRRAVRALAGLDPETLCKVTPEDMRAVLLARGWVYEGPDCQEPSKVRFTIYNNMGALGCGRDGDVPWVQVPMHPAFADYTRRVVEWVNDVATRHGDVAPAEILGEVLALHRA